MIAFIAVIVLGTLLLLGYWIFILTYRAKRRKGKSDAVAFGWAVAAVVLLSVPAWDLIPTWIAFEYYNKKEAGIKVFKTLEQWKAENPGVAETLEPYGLRDKRAERKNLGNGTFRHPINGRFVYESQNVDKLFLSVHARRYALIDEKKEEVLVRYVEVAAGNDGGLASGGPGWWAFWRIHRPTKSGVGAWSEFVKSVEKMGAEK